MKKDFKKVFYSLALSGALFSSTIAPVNVSAETYANISKNRKVDIELYKVLPVNDAIDWAIKKYGECHVVVRELPVNSGHFVYAITKDNEYVQGWSRVPDKNIYSFEHLNSTTGGFALSTNYYDYPLDLEYINELLGEKKEEEEIKESKDDFYDDSVYSSTWLVNYKKRDKAFKKAYKMYKGVPFCVLKRLVKNPLNPEEEAYIYAFSTDFNELDSGWEYAFDKEIDKNTYIFTNVTEAKYYYYALSNDMTKKLLLTNK